MSPERTLLESLRLLHQDGYESLRAYAYLYATGHWRCELSMVGSPLAPKASLFGYTSASGWDFFNDGVQRERTPEALAAEFARRLPALNSLRSPAKAYVVWFSTLLDVTGPDGVFALSDDGGYDARRSGYVRLLYRESAGAHPLTEFPLAPMF